MQHLDEGTIHAWLDGALSVDEAARVDAHARTCSECAAMVADARGLIAGAARIVSAMDVVPGGVIPKQSTVVAPAKRSLWRTLRLSPMRAALAASVMVAVASMFAVKSSNQRMEGKTASVVAASAPVSSTVKSASADSVRPRTDGRVEASANLSARTQALHDKPVVAKARDAAVAVAAVAPAAAPPAPPVAVEMVVRSPDSAQAKVVAEAPTRPSIENTLGAVRATSQLPARGVVRSLQLSDAARIPLAENDLTGCYQIANDTSDWPRSLPQRFALTNEIAPNAIGSRVVRGLDRGGRVDSTIVGDWRAIGSTNAAVTLERSGERVVFTLSSGPAVVMTRLASTNPEKPIHVNRLSCPR